MMHRTLIIPCKGLAKSEWLMAALLQEQKVKLAGILCESMKLSSTDSGHWVHRGQYSLIPAAAL